MSKIEFETLESAVEYIKNIDNERNHGYQLLYEASKWYIKIKQWTSFGMKYKWFWAVNR